MTTPPTSSPFWDPSTPPSEWPFKTCQATSQFPVLSPGALQQYEPADTPALQSKSIRSYGSSGNLAFGAMDWSEASFNGLNVASLQNASGNFVTPSSASIGAALTDATENPDGTLTFNYGDAGNTAAYAMPMVTYAVVPTSPVTPATAASLSSFLTNLVEFSSGRTDPCPAATSRSRPPLPPRPRRTSPRTSWPDRRAAPPPGGPVGRAPPAGQAGRAPPR